MTNEQLMYELQDHIIEAMIETYVSKSNNIETKDIPQHFLELGEEIKLVLEQKEVGTLISNMLNGVYEQYEIDKPDFASVMKKVTHYRPGH